MRGFTVEDAGEVMVEQLLKCDGIDVCVRKMV